MGKYYTAAKASSLKDAREKFSALVGTCEVQNGEAKLAYSLLVEAYELGNKIYGEDVPAIFEVSLVYGKSGKILDARKIDGQYGTCWMLSDDDATLVGRKFIPVGEKSRVQKNLGVYESYDIAYKAAPVVLAEPSGSGRYGYYQSRPPFMFRDSYAVGNVGRYVAPEENSEVAA